MKKLFIVLSLFACFISIGYFDTVKASSLLIVIDPGHGGMDSGASVNEVYESDLNLAISYKLKEVFEKNNYQVVLTRKDKNDLCDSEFVKKEDLNKRVQIINNSDAFCCISIHMNKFSNSKYHGAQVFYNSIHPKNIDLANSVQLSLRYLLNNTTREVVFRDNIYLLNKCLIPTVLVECGFLSNDEERNNLQKSDYQLLLASAIYYGVMNTCFSE